MEIGIDHRFLPVLRRDLERNADITFAGGCRGDDAAPGAGSAAWLALPVFSAADKRPGISAGEQTSAAAPAAPTRSRHPGKGNL